MSTYSVTLYIALDKSFEVEADSEDVAVTKAERLMAHEVVGAGFTSRSVITITHFAFLLSAVDDVDVEGGTDEDAGDEEESDE